MKVTSFNCLDWITPEKVECDQLDSISPQLHKLGYEDIIFCQTGMEDLTPLGYWEARSRFKDCDSYCLNGLHDAGLNMWRTQRQIDSDFDHLLWVLNDNTFQSYNIKKNQRDTLVISETVYNNWKQFGNGEPEVLKDIFRHMVVDEWTANGMFAIVFHQVEDHLFNLEKRLAKRLDSGTRNLMFFPDLLFDVSEDRRLSDVDDLPETQIGIELGDIWISMSLDEAESPDSEIREKLHW